MEKNFLFFILFIGVFISFYSEAQTGWQWGVKSTSSITGYGTQVNAGKTIVDKTGNVFVLGSFNCDTLHFGATALYNGVESAFVIKLDSSGNFLWAVPFGIRNSELGDIAFDNSGNIWVYGKYIETSFSISPYTLTQPSIGYMSYLTKLSQNGTVLFAENVAPSMGGTFYWGNGGIGIDSYNNVYISTDFITPVITIGASTLTNTDPSGKTSDMFIAKCDNSGNWLWAKSFGSDSTDYSLLLSVAKSGNFYVSGHFTHTLSIAGTTITSNPDTVLNPFVARFDGNGNPLWIETISSYIRDMKTDVNEYLYTTGDNTAQNAPLITKYDVNGSILWTKFLITSSGSIGTGISLDLCGNIWVCGNLFFIGEGSNFDMNFDGHILSYTSSSNAWTNPMFFAEYDAAGNYVTAQEIPSGIALKGIGMDYNSNVYVAAYSPPTGALMTFGKDTFPSYQDYLFVTKYKYDTSGCNRTVDIPQIKPSNSSHDIIIYPNPARAELTISATNKIDQITITNLIGQTLFTHIYNSEKVQINIANLPSGIYFVKINGTEVRKFVKQ